MVCNNKNQGGIGISQVKQKNTTLLMKWWWKLIEKWWWKLIENPGMMVYQILKNKYNKKEVWNRKQRSKKTTSQIWKGLQDIKDIFCAGVRYTSEDRNIINFWEDKWSGIEKLKILVLKIICYEQKQR